MSRSPYKVGLESKTLRRAKIIFGSSLPLLTILLLAGINQGITSGELNKVFIKPFKQFATDLQEVIKETPAPTPLSVPTPSPASSTTKVIINQTIPQTPIRQPAISNCIRRNIREGEFSSNKCYSQQDYEDLEYYLDRFRSAASSLAGAEASIRITCEGSDFSKDFFKDSCSRDQQTKSQAETDISKYRSIIQGIITKGR